MKRMLLLLLAIGALSITTGCAHWGGRLCRLHGSCASAPENCRPCRTGVCRGCGMPADRCCCRGKSPAQIGQATVTYPYYTTRGPRDFLARNPQSIGP